MKALVQQRTNKVSDRKVQTMEETENEGNIVFLYKSSYLAT